MNNNIFEKYRFEIPLSNNPDPGVYAGVIEDVSFQERSDQKTVVLSLCLDNDMQVKISIPLLPKFGWKIRNLFTSAGILESCKSGNKLITLWELLLNKVIYVVYDERGARDFVQRAEYERIKAGY